MVKFLKGIDKILIMIVFCAVVFLSAVKADDTITPECESAITKAAVVAMKYAETGKGYKDMIRADNAARIICGEVSS